MKRVLLQTTIPYNEDDWTIDRFSTLARTIREIRVNGDAVFEVTTRNRASTPDSPDPVLSTIDQSDFDQVWLFGVDSGDGIREDECEAISRFYRSGRGILAARDHADLGSSLCNLGGVGAAHHFHSLNQEPARDRRCIDDTDNSSISWPNYHSGKNGDFQVIKVGSPPHPILHRREGGELIEFLPAHPHEGAISAPIEDTSARVAAIGHSKTSGRPFNLAVTFERTLLHGRSIAVSSIHHFLDYNLNPASGCPSFVTEKPGGSILTHPKALDDSLQYFRNIATWLS